MADLPQKNRRLATRPIDPKRHLPIPYTQLVNPDGTANFAAIDGPKALRGAANRDCGLCGQRMGRWAFLGGPRNVEHGGYLDPPMHVSCAEDVISSSKSRVRHVRDEAERPPFRVVDRMTFRCPSRIVGREGSCEFSAYS